MSDEELIRLALIAIIFYCLGGFVGRKLKDYGM